MTATVPPHGLVGKGDDVTIEYESARTGNPQQVSAEVRRVTPTGGGDRQYTLKLYDEPRHRTIYVYTHTGEVETKERRGHMLTLGPLLDVTVA